MYVLDRKTMGHVRRSSTDRPVLPTASIRRTSAANAKPSISISFEYDFYIPPLSNELPHLISRERSNER